MKGWRRSLRAIIALLVLLTLSSRASASQPDEKALRQAVARFYAALNVMFTGNLEPMKQVWSHSENVTYMGPGGGYEIAWSRVLRNFEKQAAMKLGGKVEPADIHFMVGRDMAVVDNYEKGENIINGKAQTVLIRATSVFRKEGGRWKMVGHHTDMLPYLKK